MSDVYSEYIYQSDGVFPENLKLQVLCFLRMSYPEGFEGENENRDWINNPEENAIHVVITTQNAILVSYCAVVRKQLFHAQEIYNCWGLTGVLTYPAFRGRGFGKRIVDIGTKIIKESGADIGMFHCDEQLKDFYQKSGWAPMENAITLLGDKDHLEKSEELMMMLFLSEKALNNRAVFENTPVYFGEDSTW
jgi:predicted acetyltransferase